MTFIDQNTALHSLNSDLNPSSNLIDSRDEIDRFKFLTEFSSLINFYDQKNKINGSWNPFLMKDPVFLLANIARVNYTKTHSLYSTSINNLKQLIKTDTKEAQESSSIQFNQLFKQLIKIFMKIERWSYFMNKYHHDYNLKEFVIHKLKTEHGFNFWALLAFWKEISSNQLIQGISPADTSIFKNFSHSVWPQSKKPFWEILNVQMPLKETKDTNQETPKTVSDKTLDVLSLVGDNLLSFLNDIIEHASTEYDSISVRKGVFPDTALLRAFVKLQAIHQEQLNDISKKHLQFYYKDILKQKERNAEGDKAFIHVDLAKKTNSFFLPKGTLFKAGIDAHKNPIVFKSLNNTGLNPATITNGFTIKQHKDLENNTRSLYKVPIATPGVLKKDKTGKIASWETFGGNSEESNSPEPLSFAFASPMLLLKEGTRVITIKLSFEDQVDPQLFEQAKYYLSTKSQWLDLINKSVESSTTTQNNAFEILPSEGNNKELTLKITLQSSEKAIEKFTKHPDGLDTSWPMFKMEFEKFIDLKASPVFKAIDISVDVSNVKSFTLSNDYGVLNTTKPFQLFGPTPLVNNSFIIGNNEIFSKPLTFLNFQIDWDTLPSDFQSYYQEYNNNMDLGSAAKDDKKTETTDKTKDKTTDKTTDKTNDKSKEETKANSKDNTKDKSTSAKVASASSVIKSGKVAKSKDSKKAAAKDKTVKGKESVGFFKNIINKITKSKSKTPAKAEVPKPVDKKEPYNNGCFASNFEVLQDQEWKSLITTKQASCSFDSSQNAFVCKAYTIYVPPKPPPVEDTDTDTESSTDKNNSSKKSDSSEIVLQKQADPVASSKAVVSSPKEETKDTTSPASSAKSDNTSDPSDDKKNSDLKVEEAPKPKVDKNELLFGTDDKNKLEANSVFSFKVDPSIIKPDQTLQNEPYTYSESSKNGFIKMNLIGPEYGFGSELYTKVVSNIALKNAKELMNKKAISHLPAQVPFVPKVKLLTANYSASQTYTLDFNSSEDSIQCYTYTPNGCYQVYDSTTANSETSEDVNPDIYLTTLDSQQTKSNAISLFPTLESKGILYLALDKMVFPCELNIYLELARKAGNSPEKVNLNYRYLSKTGWKNIAVLSDSTKNFTCSGIVKVIIPEDITSSHPSMPNQQYWISIGVPNNPDTYAYTSYLQSNGLEVERTGTSFLSDTEIKTLAAGAIKGTVDPTPEISKVTQVFPSFSGRGAEDDAAMNQRVSTRLKTKNRAISSVDYFRLIKQEFPDIYFAKSIYNQAQRKTQIYLVRKFEDVNTAGAFLPMVSVCKEESINDFLNERTSAFANIEVLNFVPEYVSINAKIAVDRNYGLGELQEKINQKINLFLSPWIESRAAQVKIDSGLSKAQISNLIKRTKGVLSVSSIEIVKQEAPPSSTNTSNTVQKDTPYQTLMVTSNSHNINCSYII